MVNGSEQPFRETVPETLEQCLAEFTIAIEDEREKSWEAGHAICRAIAMQAQECDLNASPAEHKAARRALVGQFAAAGHCTLNRVVQLATVYAAFCADGDRRVKTKPWSWHRAVRNAAERTETPVVEVLAQAEQGSWGQRELDALGITGVERVSFQATCGECGLTTKTWCKKAGIQALRGARLACPYCAGIVRGTAYFGALA